ARWRRDAGQPAEWRGEGGRHVTGLSGHPDCKIDRRRPRLVSWRRPEPTLRNRRRDDHLMSTS
ncbi:MAG: hypothetical protein ACREFU_03965, partial [Acetobacteraceae bacterium]